MSMTSSKKINLCVLGCHKSDFRAKKQHEKAVCVNPTRLLRFVTFVHLPFFVRSLYLFVALLVFMKGTSCCVIKSDF